MHVATNGSGRHRETGPPPPPRVRARARLDRSGSCRAPGSDPTSWARSVPERGLNERARARARARVLCSSCPVQRLCRRTVLAVLTAPTAPTQPLPRPGQTTTAQGIWAHGVWGGLAAWEVRTLVRRSRKRRAVRALIRANEPAPCRAAA
jgi:hypothetical protein